MLESLPLHTILASRGRARSAVIAVLIAVSMVGAGPLSGAPQDAHSPAGDARSADARLPPGANATASGAASVYFDFARQQAVVVTSGGASTVALAAVDLQPRLIALRTALAAEAVHAGPAVDPAMRAALGRDLLGPLAPLLQAVRQLEVAPLSAAPLGALVPPWASDGQPLLATVTIWYRLADAPATGVPVAPELSACVPPPDEAARMPRNEGILAIAPFTAGAPPGRDDPDTLLWAMRAVARTVDLVPRNDGAPAIAGALRDRKYGLIWLRARPDSGAQLLPVLDAGPLLLWWSLPPLPAARAGAPTAPPTCLVDDPAAQAFLRQWGPGAKGAVVDLWPRSQSTSAERAKLFLTGIQSGLPVATALQQACAAPLEGRAGAPCELGWICVGNALLTAQLDAPGWLQRTLQRPPAPGR